MDRAEFEPDYRWPLSPQSADGRNGHSPTSPSPSAPTNTLAIVTFLCAIGSYLSFGALIVPAIICGHISLDQIAATGEKGTVLAKTGLVIAYFTLFITVVAILLGVTLIVITGSVLIFEEGSRLLNSIGGTLALTSLHW